MTQTIEQILFKLSTIQKRIYNCGDDRNIIGEFYTLYNTLPSIKAVSGKDFREQEILKYQKCYERLMNEE